MSIYISADSTCDLSPELLAQYNIGITPLYIVMGDKTYKDGVDCTSSQIYRYVEEHGVLCTTAAVNIGDYLDWFESKLQEHEAVLHFTISSDMSSCYQNACTAAAEFPGRVFVVDSRNLSTGIGHLAVAAAELAGAGMPAPEIHRLLTERAEKLNVSFVIDTLEYLYKGGRCSALSMLGANLLSLKPCIEVREGKMGVGKKYRGALKKCILAYIKDKLENTDAIEPHRIFITHSDSDPEIVAAAVEYVQSLHYFSEVIETHAGSTIANHCGPNCLGVLFFNK